MINNFYAKNKSSIRKEKIMIFLLISILAGILASLYLNTYFYLIVSITSAIIIYLLNKERLTADVCIHGVFLSEYQKQNFHQLKYCVV